MTACQHKDVNVGWCESMLETLPDKGIRPHTSNFPALSAVSELINLEKWGTFPFIAQWGDTTLGNHCQRIKITCHWGLGMNDEIIFWVSAWSTLPLSRLFPCLSESIFGLSHQAHTCLFLSTFPTVGLCPCGEGKTVPIFTVKVLLLLWQWERCTFLVMHSLKYCKMWKCYLQLDFLFVL